MTTTTITRWEESNHIPIFDGVITPNLKFTKKIQKMERCCVQRGCVYI